jgi:hypothetical protein
VVSLPLINNQEDSDFSGVRQHETIAGFRAACTDFLKPFAVRSTLDDNVFIFKLLKLYILSRPPSRVLAQPWEATCAGD